MVTERENISMHLSTYNEMVQLIWICTVDFPGLARHPPWNCSIYAVMLTVAMLLPVV